MSVELPTAAPVAPPLDAKPDIFGNDIANDSLGIGTRAARGGAIVLASMVTTRAMALVVTAIITRLLDPVAFGLVGMAYTITGILTAFADLGLATATVQRAHVTQEEVSASFWLNVTLGIALAALTAATAPLIAAFYREPAVQSLAIWCSLGFPLAALGAQHTALLVRRMEFGRIAVCEVIGVAISGVLALLMAARGFGPISLVAQQLACQLIISALAWVFARWLPTIRFSRRDLRATLQFGGYLTAYNFVNYFSRNLDNLVVGRFAGAGPLGLYSRAYALMLYPISFLSLLVSRVLVPTLSKFQHDLPRMRHAYVRVLKLISFASVPAMMFLLVAADDVITTIYGAEWRDAVSIFRVLCFAGLFQGVYAASGQIFVATGRTDRLFRCGTVMAVLLTIAFVVGVRWGALGVAWAYAIAFSASLLPYLRYSYATIELKMSEALVPLISILVAALVASASAWVFNHYVADAWQSLPRLLASCGTATLCYFVAIFTLDRQVLADVLHTTIKRVVYTT